MTDQQDFPVKPIGEILKLGFRGRCPRCGLGSVFKTYLEVSDKCHVCHLGLSCHDTGDGAVVPALLLVGGVICAMAFYTEVKYQPPYWVHAVLWLPMIIGFTLVTLPALKGIAIGLQHKLRSTDKPVDNGGI